MVAQRPSDRRTGSAQSPVEERLRFVDAPDDVPERVELHVLDECLHGPARVHQDDVAPLLPNQPRDRHEQADTTGAQALDIAKLESKVAISLIELGFDVGRGVEMT